MKALCTYKLSDGKKKNWQPMLNDFIVHKFKETYFYLYSNGIKYIIVITFI